MDIFNSSWTKLSPLVLQRHTHTIKLIHQSHCYSLRNSAQCLQQKTCVRHTISKSSGKNVVCVCVGVWVGLDVWKTGVFEPLSVENKRPGLRVKDHIWPMDSTDMKWSTRMCVSFVLWKTQIRTLWGWYTYPITALSDTVLLCDLPPSSLHTGTSLEPPGPESELLSGQGEVSLKPPFLDSLIHSPCNECKGC